MRVTDEMARVVLARYTELMIEHPGPDWPPEDISGHRVQMMRQALDALSHAVGQEVDKRVDWIAENHHDYWVVRVLCAETPRFYSIRKSDGQMLELPHKDSPFVPFPAVARSEGAVQQFVSCTCHDQRQKELCLNKHRCVRAYALASSGMD
jgi:hypothetical protein